MSVVSAILLAFGLALVSPATAAERYTIVVSKATQGDAAWAEVVAALKQKHAAEVLVFDKDVTEALKSLQAAPWSRYVCFVAKPEEAGRAFVAKVHVLMRQVDADPYTDGFWGILTGYDAANALRIARHKEPLTVRKVASGTDVALEMCEEGFWYDELVKNKHVKKDKGGEAKLLQGSDDTTEALVKSLTEYKPDLFVTSGHATERDWMIGFRYKNGFFKCANGELYGIDTQQKKFPIQSPNPKVYLPIGNCLMGHIDTRDAMALAWMNSAGVMQMIGYTVPTWYGYAGWGCLDYFVEQPGRYTFTEAFFANHHALIHRLKTYFPGSEKAAVDANGRASVALTLTADAKAAGLNPNDARGLLYDRDTVAFYGDPAWLARMADGPVAWEQNLSKRRGIDVWSLVIKPKRGEKTFNPINGNGSQRGGRPIVAFLPQRIKNAQILEGTELNPVIMDDFILVPNPQQCDSTKEYRVIFKAELAP